MGTGDGGTRIGKGLLTLHKEHQAKKALIILKMPLNTNLSLKSLLNAFTPPGRQESSPATPSMRCRFLSAAPTASL